MRSASGPCGSGRTGSGYRRCPHEQVVDRPAALANPIANLRGDTGRHGTTLNGIAWSISPAQTGHIGIRQHGPDDRARPLKVAARVRIPYGLPNESGQSHPSGVALLVSWTRCQTDASLYQCAVPVHCDILAPVAVFRFGDAVPVGRYRSEMRVAATVGPHAGTGAGLKLLRRSECPAPQ